MSQSSHSSINEQPPHKGPPVKSKFKRQERILPQIGKFPVLYEPACTPIATAKHHFDVPFPDFHEFNKSIVSQVSQKDKENEIMNKHLDAFTYVAAAKKVLVAGDVEYIPDVVASVKSATFELPAITSAIVESLGKFEHVSEVFVPDDPVVASGKLLLTALFALDAKSNESTFQALSTLTFDPSQQAFVWPVTFHGDQVFTTLTAPHMRAINKAIVAHGITIPVTTPSGDEAQVLMKISPYPEVTTQGNQVADLLRSKLPTGLAWDNNTLADNLLSPLNISQISLDYIRTTIQLRPQNGCLIFTQRFIGAMMSYIMSTAQLSIEKISKKITMRSIEVQDKFGSAAQMTRWDPGESRVMSHKFVSTADFIIGALVPFIPVRGTVDKKFRFESHTIDQHSLRVLYARSSIKQKSQ